MQIALFELAFCRNGSFVVVGAHLLNGSGRNGFVTNGFNWTVTGGVLHCYGCIACCYVWCVVQQQAWETDYGTR